MKLKIFNSVKYYFTLYILTRKTLAHIMRYVSQLTVRPLTKKEVAMKDRRIGFELHRSSRIVKRYMDNDASKRYVEKMTGTHGRAIGYFYNNRHRDVFQKDFEKEFNIRRSTASKILSLMESNDLITRESVDYDARLKKIVLTEKALELQSVVDNAFTRMETKIKEGITEEELDVFFRVLEKVNKNLERNDCVND